MLELTPRDYILPHMLRTAAQRFGDRPFVQFADRARTYAQADEAADRVANGLARLGVTKGTKVAIMAINSLGFIDAWVGAARAGAVDVPINTDYKDDSLR